MSLAAHPVAALFPMMEGPDFAALVADVKSNGLLQPIWLHQDGSILDGRNRYRACADAGIEGQFKTWVGPDSGVVQFVTSMNLHRRHLSTEQRAFIAAELATMTAPGNLKKGQQTPDSPNGQVGERPLVSRTEAASVMRVEPRALDRARAVAKHAPELKEKVLSGEMSLTAAAKTASAKKQKDDQASQEKSAASEARGKEILKQRAVAARLQNMVTASRKLGAWIVAFGQLKETAEAAKLVRQAIAILDKGDA